MTLFAVHTQLTNAQSWWYLERDCLSLWYEYHQCPARPFCKAAFCCAFLVLMGMVFLMHAWHFSCASIRKPDHFFLKCSQDTISYWLFVPPGILCMKTVWITPVCIGTHVPHQLMPQLQGCSVVHLSCGVRVLEFKYVNS